MDTPFTAKRFAKSIRLATVTSAGPGMSAVLSLAIRPVSRRTEIWLGNDDGDVELVQTLEERVDWRGAVKALGDLEDQIGLGGGHTDEIEVTGAEGIAAELLSLAWSGEGDTKVACALAACTDVELARLRAAVKGKSFLNWDVRERLAALLDRLSEAELEEVNTMGDLLRATLAKPVVKNLRRPGKSSPSAPDLLDVLAEAVQQTTAAAEANADAAADERATRLAPYHEQIAHIVHTWYELQLPASSNQSIGIAARRAWLSMFIEAYALEHGRLPNGRHMIPVPADDKRYPRISGIGPFQVDFDALA